MLNHILLPLDGSPLAEQALVYARNILAPDGKLTIVCAVDLPELVPNSFYPMVSASVSGLATDEKGRYTYNPQDLIRMAGAYIDQFVTPLRNTTTYDIKVITEIEEPAELIVKTANAQQVEAIVMSTHGRSGLSRWLFGSVTTKVLNAAPCPVFVIPSRVLKENAEKAQAETLELV